MISLRNKKKHEQQKKMVCNLRLLLLFHHHDHHIRHHSLELFKPLLHYVFRSSDLFAWASWIALYSSFILASCLLKDSDISFYSNSSSWSFSTFFSCLGFFIFISLRTGFWSLTNTWVIQEASRPSLTVDHCREMWIEWRVWNIYLVPFDFNKFHTSDNFFKLVIQGLIMSFHWQSLQITWDSIHNIS